ncbi:MAG: hypothetical protein R3C59_30510 [Planctomycetaceae bacterium]
MKLNSGMAAYSGETGTWDVVKLPADSNAQPSVSRKSSSSFATASSLHIRGVNRSLDVADG